MESNDIQDFLNGTLNDSKIVVRSNNHVIKYFKFLREGKRTVNKIKSYLLHLGLPMEQMRNIKIVNNEIIELTMMRIFIHDLESKIAQHLMLIIDLYPEAVLNSTHIPEFQKISYTLDDYFYYLSLKIEKLKRLTSSQNYRDFTQA